MNQENSITENQSVNSKERHLISDENFKKLNAIREEVYQVTEVGPTVRKLVNLIIEKADLEIIRDQLIKQYS